MKMHGLLRAEFTVSDGLPPDLRVGLFAQPRTYKAWVRYSNSASATEPDRKGDIRGMAIKLMGVPGRKVLDSHADADTHDFLTVTALNFPARTAGEIDALVAAVVQGPLWVKLGFLLTHPRSAWVLLTTMVRHANMLQNLYCSVVPYRFGTHAVKYIVRPHGARRTPCPSRPTPDYLRERLVRQLARGDAVFDFCVQFQRDEACMPIDDPFRHLVAGAVAAAQAGHRAHPAAALRHRRHPQLRREPVVHALALPARAPAAGGLEPHASCGLRHLVDLPA
jgi:hypothetical protein